jgi:hypothetical protein
MKDRPATDELVRFWSAATRDDPAWCRLFWAGHFVKAARREIRTS